MNLKYNVERNQKTVTIYLSGELDVFTAPDLKDVIYKIFEEDGIDLTIDLTEIEFIDSTGLGTFISAFKKAKSSDGKLKLKNPSDRAIKLLNLTGINKIIEIV